MKTEITIDGITYKVGDVLEYNKWESSAEILAIGNNTFFVKVGNDLKIESIICFDDLKNWKIKKPKKKIMVECWLNIYKNGVVHKYYTKNSADMHGSEDRIACEYVKFEYEVDE
jgi:hypothetical protein